MNYHRYPSDKVNFNLPIATTTANNTSIANTILHMASQSYENFYSPRTVDNKVKRKAEHHLTATQKGKQT